MWRRPWRNWSWPSWGYRWGHFFDPLQFAHQPNLGVNDTVIYLLQQAHLQLDGGWIPGSGDQNRLDWKSFTKAVYKKGRKVCISWGSWTPSMCANRCWRSSTSLVLPMSSSLLLLVGAAGSGPATLTLLLNSSEGWLCDWSQAWCADREDAE